MKVKSLIFIAGLCCITAGLKAQDIIYTIAGNLGQGKINLDSILIENLTNHSRILFGKLPVKDKYLINLTQKTLISGISGVEYQPAFSAITNIPGELNLKYTGYDVHDVNIIVYNMNGQTVFTSRNLPVFPGNTISVRIGSTGIYLVKAESGGNSETFKAVGSSDSQQYDITLEEGNTRVNLLKSTDPPLAFTFNIGDSLRISAFKKDYYAWPEGRTIIGSEDIDFEFRLSTVKTSGISDAYVQLDEATTKVKGFDETSGLLKIHFTGNHPEMRPGNIITVNVDSSYILRKIEKISQIGDTLIFKTKPAYMNELFINKEFKLHTGFLTPQNSLKKGLSIDEISETLTDENGFIHPFEIIFKNKEGNLIKKSAVSVGQVTEKSKADLPFRLITFNEPLNKTLYKSEDGNVNFFSHDSGLELSLDFCAEFKFNPELGEVTEETKMTKSDIIKYNYWLEGNADLMVKLALRMSDNLEISPEDPLLLFDIPDYTVNFLIGTIPVSIEFENGLFYTYNLNATAKLYADWGFEYHHTLKLGASYDNVNDDFTLIEGNNSTLEFYPLEMKGEVAADAHFELFPRIDVKFYKIFGPYFELAPFLDGRFKMVGGLSTYLASQNEEPTGFVAWDTNFGVGLDFRVGAKLEALWGLLDKEFGPEIYHLIKEENNPDSQSRPIYKAPDQLLLVSEIPKTVASGTKISFKFKVVNSSLFSGINGKPVPFCPVYFNCGECNVNKILLTDLNGEVSVDWTAQEAGTKEFTAEIYKADGFNRENATLIDKIAATTYVSPDYSSTSGTFKDFRDENNYNWVKIGNQVWMAENLKFIPSDELITPPSIPVINQSTSDYEKTYTTPYYYVYGSSGLFQDFFETQMTIEKYGVLYNNKAAKSACPEDQGWYLPTDNDWAVLEQFIADKYGYVKNSTYDYWENVGKHLKSSTWGGADSFGFDALPAGRKEFDSGSFTGEGYAGYWWSSSPWIRDGVTIVDCSYVRYLSNATSFYRTHMYNQYGLSVRCIRK